MESNMMLDAVLGSPLLTKIQASHRTHSGAFHDHHQASAHEYICTPISSSSVNDIRLHDNIVPLTEDSALYHPMSHNSMLPLSSSVSPPSSLLAVEDAALINYHLLAHANTTFPYISCKKEEGEVQEEEEEQAAVFVTSVLGPRSSLQRVDDSNSSYQSYVSQGSSASSSLSSSYGMLAEHVQLDVCRLSSEDLSFLKSSCLISNEVQESTNTACTLNCIMTNGGSNPHMAALSTSSSSSTPSSNISSGQLNQLAANYKENLQAWMALDSTTDTIRVHDKQSALFNIINRSSMVDVDHKSSSCHVVSAASMAATPDLQKPKKRRKRKRNISQGKNVEEMETQRMTHIAVERNRRKQMNEHLRALRLLMPQSYVQRGDQASIVGGTIRFVEELEQVLQSLRLQMQLRTHHMDNYGPFGQKCEQADSHVEETYANTSSCMANVEVTILTSSTIFMKVLAQKKPHQLFQILIALANLSLRVTHINITTIGIITLYSFNLEIDGDCQLLTPFELAQSIQRIFCS